MVGIMEEGDPSDGGLYYMRVRYYDPAVGRFISEDPSGFSSGVNLYGYVVGNPVNFFDADGLDTYYINNIIGTSIPTNNLFSHSYTAITDYDNEGNEYVSTTYSFVATNGGAWEDPQNAQNRSGAQKAINTGVGVLKLGNDSLDQHVTKAFESNKANPAKYNFISNNCKHQALKLIDAANTSYVGALHTTSANNTSNK